MERRTLTREAFRSLGTPDLVYVREVLGQEVLSNNVIAEGVEVGTNQILFAVHGADGARLAVLITRESAFAAAEAHNLIPVSVH